MRLTEGNGGQISGVMVDRFRVLGGQISGDGGQISGVINRDWLTYTCGCTQWCLVA